MQVKANIFFSVFIFCRRINMQATTRSRTTTDSLMDLSFLCSSISCLTRATSSGVKDPPLANSMLSSGAADSLDDLLPL